MFVRLLLSLLFPVGLFAQPKTYESDGMKFQVDVLADRDDVIWGFDFLPDGKVIFSERSGKLALLDPKTKSVTEVSGAPKVSVKGQSGLLDVKLHPNFSKNNWLYLTYTEPFENGKRRTALGRGELKGNQLVGFKRLFATKDISDGDVHFGSRIAFLGEHVFITVGDYNQRPKVQNLGAHNGKVLRLNHDGTAADGNPFAKRDGALAEIWSYGHRSPQGLVVRPGTDELWEGEMGPRGGDEINLIKPGANYGWPDVTFGREYWGPSIGAKTKEGTEAPIAYWVPSISPSNITFYSGDLMPKWKGNLFLGTLSGTHLRRLVLDGTKVVKQEELLSDIDARFRSLRTSPEGHLYFSTDDGRIARLTPLETAKPAAKK